MIEEKHELPRWVGVNIQRLHLIVQKCTVAEAELLQEFCVNRLSLDEATHLKEKLDAFQERKATLLSAYETALNNAMAYLSGDREATSCQLIDNNIQIKNRELYYELSKQLNIKVEFLPAPEDVGYMYDSTDFLDLNNN